MKKPTAAGGLKMLNANFLPLLATVLEARQSTAVGFHSTIPAGAAGIHIRVMLVIGLTLRGDHAVGIDQQRVCRALADVQKIDETGTPFLMTTRLAQSRVMDVACFCEPSL